MALVAMVVYDPPGEPRTELLEKCLHSLCPTLDWLRHRLILIDNGIADSSRRFIDHIRAHFLIGNMLGDGKNIGTARAINQAWKLRNPGEHCVKIDSDVVLHEPGWLDKLEECVGRDPKIGIIGLKRKDLAESPHNPPGQWSHSTLHMLRHKLGESWLVVERVNHVMGTCQLYNSALLDKIGYLVQFSHYSFDDSLAAVRCEVAGFYNCFLCNCPIDHPDPGGTPYTAWKQREAARLMPRYQRIIAEYKSGKRSVYSGPDEVLE